MFTTPRARVQVSSRWFLGGAMCDAWTTLDLICCTSSILHLLAISLDRYWAVTQLDYIHHRSTRRIAAMIVASWSGSVVISAPPLFIHDPQVGRVGGSLTLPRGGSRPKYLGAGSSPFPSLPLPLLLLSLFPVLPLEVGH